MMTPERSMEIQRLLGSDIVMAFDECPPNGVDAKRAEASMERSMRWAARSRAGFDAGGEHAARSALFGIQHGSEEHTSELQSLMRISYAVFCLTKKMHVWVILRV